ncbi:MAG: MFS transporter [Armatimonadetes bacterium]|nr:MFS transporter [Armatimonadota bacterium]
MSDSPSRLEDLRTLANARADAAFSTAFMTLVGGGFLIGFVKSLNGSDLWIGLISAIPPLLGLLQIPGALWGRGFKSYKKFIFPGGLMWRLFHLPIVVLPLMGVLGAGRLPIIVLCLAFAFTCVQLVDPIYNDWLAEMVPSNSRGWFYSRRNAIAGITGAVVGLAGGLILDIMKSQGHEAAGYTTVFGVGWICSVVSMSFFLRMTDRPRLAPQKVSLRSVLPSITEPYGDPQFRRVLLFLFAFVFGQVFMGGLLTAYALESLKLPMTLIQGTGLIQASAQLVAARWWGFFSDKYGNKPVLAILTIGITITPVMWFFTKPSENLHNMIVLTPGHLLSGVVWAGVGLCQFNLLLNTANPEKRANYIASGQSLISITAALSPFLGSLVMAHLRGSMPVAQAYLSVLGVTTALRFFSLFFLLPVREEGSIAIRDTLRQFKRVTPTGFAALRKLTTSSDVQARSTAMAQVAERNLGMAADEVIKTLHDPTPRLRREAAAALAEIGGTASEDALIHQLDDHPDLVEEEALESLGRIGTERAVPYLLRYLDSPSPQLRRSAAKALGRIGAPSAEDALILSAMSENDPDLRRSSLQALRMLGSSRAAHVIEAALMDRHPSVRIAACEAVDELRLVGLAEAIRTSLATYRDEAASEAAYVLGAVGSRTDIPIILQVANECVSMITRRRCLLGIARMLEVESDAYRVFLMEGMARDAELLKMFSGKARSNDTLHKGMTAFSAGRDGEALTILATAAPGSILSELCEPVVPEAFIIAALYFQKISDLMSK